MKNTTTVLLVISLNDAGQRIKIFRIVGRRATISEECNIEFIIKIFQSLCRQRASEEIPFTASCKGR